MVIEIILVSLVVVLSLCKKGLLFDAPIPVINDIYIDENNYVNINLEKNDLSNNIYYLIKKDNTMPDINSKDWKKINGNSIKYLFDGPFYAFFKNDDNVITMAENTDSLIQIISFSLNKSDVYIAVKGIYTPTLNYEIVGSDEIPYWYSDNTKIAKVDQNGKITGVKKGNTKVHVKLVGKDISVNVVVTNLITVKPKKYDRKKKYLPCGKYTKAENDLLDAILKDKKKILIMTKVDL